jgi:hypothetical protein
MAGSSRRRVSLTALLAAIALGAVALAVVTARLKAERRRQFREVALVAAALHRREADRLGAKYGVIRSEQDLGSDLQRLVGQAERLGDASTMAGERRYLACLRDALPWQGRWLDLQRDAADYYREIGRGGAPDYYREIGRGGAPPPGRAAELARTQARLLDERRDLLAQHRGVAGMTVLNPVGVLAGIGGVPRQIAVSDPFDIRDAPDVTRPGHTFKDLSPSEP